MEFFAHSNGDSTSVYSLELLVYIELYIIDKVDVETTQIV